MKKAVLLVTMILSATAALAHNGVKDPQVMARMNLMSMIADDMKTLGRIAKGSSSFDTAVITKHAKRLADHATQIEALFKDKATDPKSESRDEIWTDFSGFKTAASKMEAAAAALGKVEDKAAFQAQFGTLGKTCSGCHKDYRTKK